MNHSARMHIVGGQKKWAGVKTKITDMGFNTGIVSKTNIPKASYSLSGNFLSEEAL